MKKLTKEDLPIGTKVVPHSKTYPGFDYPELCRYWSGVNKPKFLYVVGHDDGLILNTDIKEKNGSLYSFSDVTIYEEPKQDFENPTEEQKELIRYWIGKIPLEMISINGINSFIEKHLSSKPNIENNTWYFIERPEHYKQTSNEKPALIFTSSTGYWYGFCHSGEWTNIYGKDISLYKVTKATEQEVTEPLIEEAKRRGYKPNQKMICADGFETNGFTESEFKYFMHENKLCIYTHVYPIMEKGKWAEIIDDKAELKETIARLEKELETLKKQLK